MEHRTIASLERQLTSLPLVVLHQAHEQTMISVAIFGGDKSGEAALEHFLALLPQQQGAGQVDFGDQRLAGKGEVADGGELI
jgi:hypothetical protein